MAGSMGRRSHTPDPGEREYLVKIGWLWGRLTPDQRSRIEGSMSSDTLRQEHSRHCIIANAVGESVSETAHCANHLLSLLTGFANAIFYDGPSYEGLLGRKPTREERDRLDDIYYARIGSEEYQYTKANDLIRFYMSGRMAAA